MAEFARSSCGRSASHRSVEPGSTAHPRRGSPRHRRHASGGRVPAMPRDRWPTAPQPAPAAPPPSAGSARFHRGAGSRCRPRAATAPPDRSRAARSARRAGGEAGAPSGEPCQGVASRYPTPCTVSIGSPPSAWNLARICRTWLSMVRSLTKRDVGVGRRHQVLAGEGAPRLGGDRLEQRELRRRQGHVGAGPGRHVGLEIDHQPAAGHPLRAGVGSDASCGAGPPSRAPPARAG